MKNQDLKRTVRVGITLGAIAGLVGCAQPVGGDESQTEAPVQSENGLSANGFSMNGNSMNGMSMNGLSANGFSGNGLSGNGFSMNGLSGNGLSSTNGLITTDGGRQVIQYLVKCALPNGRSITKGSYTFQGSLGVAPEWETGSCNMDCQERVSACMLAHVNNAGVHIMLWMVSESAIGWGMDTTNYPYQEGSFFGNLFPAGTSSTGGTGTGWKGHYCIGKDFYTGSVPGRLGTPLNANVYTDPYGGNVECGQSGQCNAHGSDGYNYCNTYDGKRWNHVVTVWRNFDPNTNYKICSYGWGPGGQGSECLGVVGGSTASNAAIEIRGFNNSNTMKWKVLQVAAGKYKLQNVNSGLVLDREDGTPGLNMVQHGYSSSDPGQQIIIDSLADNGSQWGRYLLTPSSLGGYSFAPDSVADGQIVRLSNNLTMDSAKWVISPL